MVLAVICDRMAFVVRPLYELGIALHLASDHEEGRFDAVRGQDIEHSAGVRR